LYKSDKTRMPLQKISIFLGSVWSKYYCYLQNRLPILLGETRISGLRIKYRSTSFDRLIIEEIFDVNSYPFDDFQLAKTALVIDVGAHIGCFTMKAAGMVKEGRVFSFEPERNNYRILRRNIRLNDLSNVYIFNQGIAYPQGKRKLYTSSLNTGGHSLFPEHSGKYDLADCITLQHVFANNRIANVDLLKLDCEGAEYEILYNTPKEYLDRIRKIVIEYHDFEGTNNSIHDLVEFLTRHGFKAEKISRYSSITGLAYFCK